MNEKTKMEAMLDGTRQTGVEPVGGMNARDRQITYISCPCCEDPIKRADIEAQHPERDFGVDKIEKNEGNPNERVSLRLYCPHPGCGSFSSSWVFGSMGYYPDLEEYDISNMIGINHRRSSSV